MDFTDKINYFQREIRNLKTSHVKTATTIATLEKPTSVTVPLHLFGSAGQYWEIISNKKAIVALTSTDGTDMVSALYLKGVTPSNLNSRYIFIHRRGSVSGKSVFEISVYSQNESDYNILSGGGSVNLNYSLTAVGSSNYTIAVTYEDFNPWAV